MKKYFLLTLLLSISVYLNTGCNSADKKSQRHSHVKKFKSGNIMIKDDNEETEDFYTPDPSIGNVNVGPGEVQFGPEN